MFTRTALILFLTVSPAIAESGTSSKPSFEEIMESFKVGFQLDDEGRLLTASGEILGEEFGGTRDAIEGGTPFRILITPLSLPRQKAYFAAVLLNDIYCMEAGTSVQAVSGSEKIHQDGSAWAYKAACAGKSP